MLTFMWPVALIIICNTLYQICAKSIPKEMDVMASMIVTYFVATVLSVILFFVMGNNGSLAVELNKFNWATIFLGMCIVGLEVGFIYAYKVGWAVSMLSIVQSVILALALLTVGYLLYHEAITVSKVVGMAVCLVGLYIIRM